MLVPPPDRFGETPVPAGGVRIDVAVVARHLGVSQVRLHHERELHAGLCATTNKSGPRPDRYRCSSAGGDSTPRSRWMLQEVSTTCGVKPARSSTAASDARLKRCRWSA